MNNDLPINVNIYIIHYEKLIQREDVLIKIQNTCNDIVRKNKNISFDIKKILKFDPETLNNEFMKRIFDGSDIKEEDGGNTTFNKFKMSTYHNNFISNCLKHLDAINNIVKQTKDDDVNIVFEDDVVYDNKFEEYFTQFLMKKMYKTYDMIFFGLPGLKDSDDINENELNLFPVNEPGKVLPCCDSYFISKECAIKLSKEFIPIRYPNNIQLSYLIDKCNVKIARTYPNIMADGSKLGFVPSTISPNNILLFNTSYKIIYKMLEKETLTKDEIDKINKIFSENSIKNSADFLFLEGLFYLRIQNYEKCKELFDKAIEQYELHKSPLNNQSAIIKNYIELSKHIQ